jgi:hypothetical protein
MAIKMDQKSKIDDVSFKEIVEALKSGKSSSEISEG